MIIVEEYCREGKSTGCIHLRIDNTVLLEIVAGKGTFGDIEIKHRIIEEVDNGSNKEANKIPDIKK